MAYYEALDGGRVRVHAGCPIPSSVLSPSAPSSSGSLADSGPVGAFDVVELPAVERAATLLYRGPMDNVMPSVQALVRWIDTNGFTS